MNFLLFFSGGFISALLALMLSAVLIVFSFNGEKSEVLFFVFVEEIVKFIVIFSILRFFSIQTDFKKIFVRAFAFALGFSLLEFILIFLSDKSLNYLFIFNVVIHFISVILLISAAQLFSKKNKSLLNLILSFIFFILAIFSHFQYNLFAL